MPRFPVNIDFDVDNSGETIKSGCPQETKSIVVQMVEKISYGGSEKSNEHLLENGLRGAKLPDLFKGKDVHTVNPKYNTVNEEKYRDQGERDEVSPSIVDQKERSQLDQRQGGVTRSHQPHRFQAISHSADQEAEDHAKTSGD